MVFPIGSGKEIRYEDYVNQMAEDDKRLFNQIDTDKNKVLSIEEQNTYINSADVSKLSNFANSIQDLTIQTSNTYKYDKLNMDEWNDINMRIKQANCYRDLGEKYSKIKQCLKDFDNKLAQKNYNDSDKTELKNKLGIDNVRNDYNRYIQSRLYNEYWGGDDRMPPEIDFMYLFSPNQNQYIAKQSDNYEELNLSEWSNLKRQIDYALKSSYYIGEISSTDVLKEFDKKLGEKNYSQEDINKLKTELRIDEYREILIDNTCRKLKRSSVFSYDNDEYRFDADNAAVFMAIQSMFSYEPTENNINDNSALIVNNIDDNNALIVNNTNSSAETKTSSSTQYEELKLNDWNDIKRSIEYLQSNKNHLGFMSSYGLDMGRALRDFNSRLARKNYSPEDISRLKNYLQIDNARRQYNDYVISIVSKNIFSDYYMD